MLSFGAFHGMFPTKRDSLRIFSLANPHQICLKKKIKKKIKRGDEKEIQIKGVYKVVNSTWVSSRRHGVWQKQWSGGFSSCLVCQIPALSGHCAQTTGVRIKQDVTWNVICGQLQRDKGERFSKTRCWGMWKVDPHTARWRCSISFVKKNECFWVWLIE